MKNTTYIPYMLISVFVMLSLTGCASSHLTNSMVKRNGTITVENVEMLQRPIEYTVKEGKTVNADASASWLFGIFPLSGKNVSLNAPIMGVGGSLSKSEAEAIKKILDQNPEADGVLVTQSSVDKSGFPGIYTVENSTVKGRVLSIVNLGTLSKDEWRELRTMRSTATGSDGKKKPWNLMP